MSNTQRLRAKQSGPTNKQIELWKKSHLFRGAKIKYNGEEVTWLDYVGPKKISGWIVTTSGYLSGAITEVVVKENYEESKQGNIEKEVRQVVGRNNPHVEQAEMFDSRSITRG